MDKKQNVDCFAWDVISIWSKAIDFNPIYNGLDFSELTKFFLWDKVGRAIRFQDNDDSLWLERELLVEKNKNIHNKFQPPQHHQKKTNVNFLNIFHLFYRWSCQKKYILCRTSFFRANKKRICYIPVYARPLIKTVDALNHLSELCLVVPPNASHLSGVQVVPPITKWPDLIPDEIILQLFHSIIIGLEKQNVILLKEDRIQLHLQLFQMQKGIRHAEAQLNAVQPDMLFVHGDNHPPHQYYVLLSKRMGVPVFMLQHGLDCEHSYLDIPYADYIAVWGKERKSRYAHHNANSIISVTGNPEYDSFRIPKHLNCIGDYWLWVTRPHNPKKCYLPSRKVREGLDILNAIIGVLHEYPGKRLIIKPHPYDYTSLYLERLERSNLSGRVELSNQAPLDLYPNASLVFTEDSTAGLEAMFMGKPLIHVHFCKSPPVMPFCTYNAALPGFDSSQLKSSIEKVLNQELWKEKMHHGQVSFIYDFACNLDGNSSNRVVNWFVKTVREFLGTSINK